MEIKTLDQHQPLASAVAEAKPKSRRGGARPGAGRKPSGRDPLAGAFFYVIHEVENAQVCKIGVALNPFSRLASHQCSNWRRLKIAVLFDCGSQLLSQVVEKHAFVAFRGRQVLGEWFEVSPEQIAEEVMQFGCENGIDLRRVDLNEFKRVG